MPDGTRENIGIARGETATDRRNRLERIGPDERFIVYSVILFLAIFRWLVDNKKVNSDKGRGDEQLSRGMNRGIFHEAEKRGRPANQPIVRSFRIVIFIIHRILDLAGVATAPCCFYWPHLGNAKGTERGKRWSVAMDECTRERGVNRWERGVVSSLVAASSILAGSSYILVPKAEP